MHPLIAAAAASYILERCGVAGLQPKDSFTVARRIRQVTQAQRGAGGTQEKLPTQEEAQIGIGKGVRQAVLGKATAGLTLALSGSFLRASWASASAALKFFTMM